MIHHGSYLSFDNNKLIIPHNKGKNHHYLQLSFFGFLLSRKKLIKKFIDNLICFFRNHNYLLFLLHKYLSDSSPVSLDDLDIG